MANSNADKTRENRLRRMAQRQGFILVKSKARDPLALTYGRWMISDARTGEVIEGEKGMLSTDAVERLLRKGVKHGR
jgi:hypothetical protein